MGCIKFFNFLIRMFTQPRANQIMNKRKERVELQAGHKGLSLSSSTQIYTFTQKDFLIISFLL